MFLKMLLLVVGLLCIQVSSVTLDSEILLPVHNERNAYSPNVGYGDDVFLVVWQSGRLGAGDLSKEWVFEGDIVGCRVDKDGNILDATPFVICSAPDLQEKPRVVYGNGLFLVVWQDLRNGKDWDVYSSRVTSGGVVLDSNGILVSGGAHNQALPKLTWQGNDFWIVWQDFRSQTKGADGWYKQAFYEVYGGRVSTEGVALDANGILLFTANYHFISPATASFGAGKSFTVSATRQWSKYVYVTPITVGHFVTDDLLGDTVAYAPYISGSDNIGSNCLASSLAASSKRNYLIAWNTHYDPSRKPLTSKYNVGFFDSLGQRKGVSIRSVPICLPDVCWGDSLEYLVAWHEDGRPDVYSNIIPHDLVFARFLSSDGVPSAVTHAISGSLESPARYACVAANGSGSAIIAYEKHPSTIDEKVHIGFRIAKSATAAIEKEMPSLNGVSVQLPNNPFTGILSIHCQNKQERNVVLSVYDIRGRLIRTLHNGLMSSGVHNYFWNGKDGSGRMLGTGLYFVRLRSTEGRLNILRKVLMVK